MRFALVFTAVCLFVTGCAVPKSREEMLASAKSVERVCSSELSPAEAVQRLKSAWAACFVAPRGVDVVPVGQTVVAHERSRVIVTSEQVGSTSVLIARLAPSPFGMLPTPLSNAVFLVADIQATNECRSEITVRASNSHWEKRSLQTPSWLANPSVMPKEAECNR
jgi:hypothetical protein